MPSCGGFFVDRHQRIEWSVHLVSLPLATAVAVHAGRRSQVTGLTSAGFVAIVFVTFTWFFEELPRSVLSAIVIAAVWGLMDVGAFRRYLTIRRADFVAATVE